MRYNAPRLARAINDERPETLAIEPDRKFVIPSFRNFREKGRQVAFNEKEKIRAFIYYYDLAGSGHC